MKLRASIRWQEETWDISWKKAYTLDRCSMVCVMEEVSLKQKVFFPTMVCGIKAKCMVVAFMNR